MKKIKSSIIAFVTLLAFIGVTACSDDKDGTLQNDLMKKTYGPLIVGNTIEFVYALGAVDGSRLKSAEVVASVPGASGTEISKKSHYTNYNGGEDVEVTIGTENSTSGAISKITLIDTTAVALRYFYVVPEEARGKQVSFTFSGISDTGNASKPSETYNVSNMTLATGLKMDKKRCYFSIENLKAYTKDEIEAQNLVDKIDLVFVDKPTMGSGWNFGRALVAPSNDKGYLNASEIPTGAKNKTLIERRYWPDGQLKTGNMQTVFVDDIDLIQAAFDNTITYAYGLNSDQGVLIKTSDNRFAAYLYINSYASEVLTFGIKTLKLQ